LILSEESTADQHRQPECFPAMDPCARHKSNGAPDSTSLRGIRSATKR
jgi:hypothetical protein